jgi:cell division protein FtsB
VIRCNKLLNGAGMQRQFTPTKLLLLWVLYVLGSGSGAVLAQTPATDQTSATPQSQVTSDILKKVDQLVQQNQQLEKQNHELVSEIESLRQLLAQQASVSPTSSNGESTSGAKSVVVLPDSVNKQTGQRSGQASAPTQGDDDDKALLPQASEGNNAIFGEFNPGRGFTVGRGEYGELNISGYMAVRYLNQMPGDQSGTDHLGRPVPIDPRQDFQFHRVMLFSQGWLFSPKFQYSTFVWTVQDTNQVAVGGALYYDFGKFMNLGAGWNAYPGTLSLQGSHPYWLSFDRVMADEFFRPYFSQGIFAKGNILPKLEYRWMVGNNNSNLDIPAVKLDRDLSTGFAITWLPTTGEFGPRGAFGDYEGHEQLATRFNLAYTYSPEDRQAPIGSPAGNTTLRLSDSLNIFDTGALANGVTVEKAHYQLLSLGAGMKYHGLFLQGEGYGRRLDNFVADGKLPLGVVRDFGFYVQLGYMVVPQKIELYGATSYIFGQFNDPKEFIVGGNYYPWHSRNARLNIQLINVDRSPVSSTFGFYLGQLKGQVFTIGMTGFY